MTLKIFFIFILTFRLTASQVKWEWANPPTTSNYLYTVEVLDSLSIIGFGESGTIIRSSDLGTSWFIPYQTQITEDIYASHFFNDKSGIICCGKGEIYLTEDGGKNWHPVDSGSKNNLNDIYFKDDLNGVIVGDQGTLLLTTDGGSEWGELNNSHKGNLNGVYFSPSGITAVGDSGIIFQIIGVENEPVIRNSGTEFKLNNIEFYDEKYGIAVGDSGIALVTADGGLEWSKYEIAKGRNVFDVAVKSNGDVICLSQQGLTSRTNIKNIEWRNRNTGSIYDLIAIDLLNDNYGAIVGQYGNLHSTRNGFKNWFFFFDHSRSTYKNLFSVKMGGEDFAIATGWNGTLMQTLDYGNNWFKASAKGADEYRGIEIIGDSVCWAVGEDGVIRYSENRGTNWNPVYSDVTDDLNDIRFINSRIGYIVGDNGLLFETLDSGNDWKRIQLDISENLNSIGVGEGGEPILAGNSGIFVNKHDNDWEVKIIADGYDLYCIEQRDGMIIIGGEDGLILRSPDNGNEWQTVDNKYKYDLNDLEMLPEGLCYFVGEKGLVLESINGGANWHKIYIPTNRDLHGIDFLSTSSGFVVGLHGTILRVRR